MKHSVWLLCFLSTVGLQASSIDIYKPAGEAKGCSTQISSLLKQAYSHYPSITASQRQVLSAKAQIESAKWNYFPTPSIDYSQGSAGRTGQTYRIDQPLWTGGKLDALSDLAYARGDEAKYTLGESGYALSEKVLSVIQALIQADGEMKAFEQGRKDLEELSQMLERRVKAGVSSESDQALIDARMSQIEGDIIIATSHYDMARSQLALLTGRKKVCAIKFKGDSLLHKKISMLRVEQDMLSTHPSLKKKTAQVSMAKAEKRKADADVMPNVSLRAEHQRGSLYDDNRDNSDTLAYVAVSFNPGAGLSSLSNMESAKYRVLQAQDEYRVQEQELKNVLVRDYSDYVAASSRLESLEYTIESSKKVLASYKRLFLAGKRQWLDLVNASREVTQNYVSLAALRSTLIAASYRLALTAGKIHFSKRGRL